MSDSPSAGMAGKPSTKFSQGNSIRTVVNKSPGSVQLPHDPEVRAKAPPAAYNPNLTPEEKQAIIDEWNGEQPKKKAAVKKPASA